MGVSAVIGFDQFPKQGSYLGKRVEVIFRYSATRMVYGEVVRDDMEGDFRTIIKLDDGRYILADECQYRPALTAGEKS